MISLPPALLHPDFRRLWTSMLCSGLAMQMAQVAIGWQVYSIHPEAVYSAAVVLLVASSLLLLPVRRPESVPQSASRPAGLQELFAGVRFIRATPVILGAITLDLFAVLLGGAVALLPLFAKS